MWCSCRPLLITQTLFPEYEFSTPKTSANCYWTLHRPPHAHNCRSCHSDTMAANGMKGDRSTHTAHGQRQGVPHTFSFLLHHTAHTLCYPALPAPAHTPGTARKRDEEVQENSLRSTASMCFKFLQSATHSSVNEATLKIFIGKHPGLQRVLQTK